ncbi:MAG: hypothetical protein EOP82_09535 [Variovorax sp.]|nr:MAG: hypothetical protein EOP82_09535 [Variovorax sp.]
MTTLSEFLDPRTHGFVRVAVAVPRNRVADSVFNAAETVAMDRQASAQGRWSLVATRVVRPEAQKA